MDDSIIALRLILETKNNIEELKITEAKKNFYEAIDVSETPGFVKILESNNFLVLKKLLLFHSEIESPSILCTYVTKFLHTSFLHNLVNDMIQQELSIEIHKECILRTDNATTTLMTAILKEYAMSPMKKLIYSIICLLRKERKKYPVSIFTGQMETEEPEKVMPVVQHFSKLTRMFFSNFYEIKWSTQVRKLIATIFTTVESKFEGMGVKIVGSILFLRFICPLIVSPHKFNIASHSSCKSIEPSLVLFSKLIYNITNNIEFGDNESYVSCLNVIIKKYAKKTEENLKQLIKDSIDSNKSSSISDLRLSNNYEYQSAIELYTSTHALRIWQELKKIGQIDLANKFKSWNSSNIQDNINLLSQLPYTINLSIYNIHFIKNLFQFFASKESDDVLKQEVLVIKEQGFEKNLLQTIFIIAAVHNKSYSYFREFAGLGVIPESVISDEEIINFNDYDYKMKLLIDYFSGLSQMKIVNWYSCSRDQVEVLCDSLTSLVKFNHEVPKNQEKLSAILKNPPLSWRESDIVWILESWNVPRQFITMLVPAHIPDGSSLLGFNCTILKDLGVSIGVRKQFERELNALESTRNDMLEKSKINLVQKPLADMNVTEVANWFKQLGFGMYAPILENNNITGSSLMRCDLNDLKNLGFDIIGHRKAIYRAIKKESESEIL